MKKFMSLVVAIVATVTFGSLVFAGVSSNTYTGFADFSDSGSAEFSFTLNNVTSDAVAQDIRWSSATAFNPGSTDKWVRSEQYAVVAATVTLAGFNVYMYQTNTDNGSVYQSTTPRTDGEKKVYNGLVRKGSYGGEVRGYIPLAYSFVGIKNPAITFEGTPETSQTRADRFLCDAADSNAPTDFPDGKGNYTLIASVCGPVFGVTDTGQPWSGSEVENNTAYMYFFGNFRNIQGKDIYGTDRLHVVQVTE